MNNYKSKLIKVDIISDVHGCYKELWELLEKLGYLNLKSIFSSQYDYPNFYPPEGRLLIVNGDLNDKGLSYVKVFCTLKSMVERGHAIINLGNHDDKLKRYLKHEIDGIPWKGNLKHGLAETIAELDQQGLEFKKEVYEFLASLPYKFETEDLIVVHGAYKETKDGKEPKDFYLYGEVDRRAGLDHRGYPKRLKNWKKNYKGKKTIVVGHVIHSDELRLLDESIEPSSERVFITDSGAKIISIDFGCCIGGELAAYRHPEHEFVTVKAKKVY
jgi:protein phosphatase